MDRNAPTRVVATYGQEGLVTLIIWWKGEQIEVVPEEANVTIREFQRADEIVQGLLTGDKT